MQMALWSPWLRTLGPFCWVPICRALPLSAVIPVCIARMMKRAWSYGRGADVKDSGSILPSHGGMLDRIDAMLFAVPVVWAFRAWMLMQ